MEMFDYEKKHLQTLREALAECTVLLKANGDFPLDAPCKIAAYGNGVRGTLKGGTGSGEVNSRYSVSVEQGLENAGFTITTKNWMHAYEAMYARARKEFISQTKEEAKKKKLNPAIYGMGRPMPEPEYQIPLEGEGDVAIYVLSRISGEGNDRSAVRGDIKLSETEKRDILALNRSYPKFMLVLNVGGVVDLGEVQEVENILILSQLGVETGDVLADILLGKANPSGKLTTTWAAWEDYADMGTFGEHNDTRYREGIYVGYRYFDTVGKRPLFPFGFGLSYTTFAHNVNSVDISGSVVTVKSTVINTGRFSGKETLQVYVSAPDGKLDKVYQELAGFAKTDVLKPEEAEEISITFDIRDLANYDMQRAAYILEPGQYIVRVGDSSMNTKIAAVVELNEEKIVKLVRNTCGKADYTDWKPGKRASEDVPGDVPVLSLDEVRTESIQYDVEEAVDEEVKKLTNEQLVYANIGAFNPRGGILSIIGNASTNVAGAAGESTSMLINHGFPAVIMADGPAGLRLTKQFYRDKKGAHGVGSASIPETVLEFMPAPLRLLTGLLNGKSKAPKGATIEYQYCTALPIGTALAQSWNPEFAECCGDIVGDEMERFGVNFWLAPALNIHRSILCGRNFEYFSEDPMISGKFAAAITRGVQAHSGRAVTIKHFAANNQENNRYGNNSIVSERAMREIYLKGFGICIQESQPHAVMTSYNLLNGTHTSERRDLSQDVLRSEFNFQGIIMTDWVVGGSVMNTKEDTHPSVRPHLVAAAGGDLFMPGGKQDFDDMMQGLRDGKLTRQQLMINATRVKRMVNMLTK